MLIELNLQPNERQLRQFGCLCLPALPLLTWIWTGSLHSAVLAGIIGGVCLILALLQPRWLKPLFIGLTLVALPIGILVGELILLCIFFGLFVPLSICFRLIRRDALRRRWSPTDCRDAITFWVPRKPSGSPRSYFRQF